MSRIVEIAEPRLLHFDKQFVLVERLRDFENGGRPGGYFANNRFRRLFQLDHAHPVVKGLASLPQEVAVPTVRQIPIVAFLERASGVRGAFYLKH